MIGSIRANPYEQMEEAEPSPTKTKNETSSGVKSTKKRLVLVVAIACFFLIAIFFAMCAAELQMVIQLRDHLVNYERAEALATVYEKEDKTFDDNEDLLILDKLSPIGRGAKVCPPRTANMMCFYPTGLTSCYCLIQLTKTWEEAKEYCKQRVSNSSLVSVESKGEDDFLTIILLSEVHHKRMTFHDAVWTSGTAKGSGKSWIWESTGDAIHVYRNWCPGEPNRLKDNGHHLQKQLENGGCWNDTPGSRREKFVCEVPL